MHEVLHAIRVFFEHLAAVHWRPLGIAIACHLLKLGAASRAWRNVVAAAYPRARVRWRSLFGAFVAGTGVNAVLPARGGDAVKLYIAKRRVDGATYTTLAATIVLLTLVDVVISGSLLVWAISIGVLPGLQVLPHLPSFDFGWFFRHPRLGAALGGAFLLLLLAAGVWLARKVEAFKQRVAQGFAAFRDKRYWLRHVVAWQLLDWSLRLTVVFFFLRALGIPATIHNALLVQVSQSLSTVFPFSPAGIGTEQAFLLYIFRRVAARSTVLAFSVGMRVTLVIVNATLGFGAILVMLRTLRFRRVVDADSARQPAR